jgi:hypothetical protein
MNVQAPPQPPVFRRGPDELEALIREARQRQRRRRIAIAVVLLLAGAAVVAYAVTNSRPNRAAQAEAPAGAGASECRAGQLRIAYVRKGAVMGEEGGLLRFTNIGRGVCSISGWPTVVAVRGDGSRFPALRIDHAPMLFATYWQHGPRVPTVMLHHGASGYAILGGFDNPIQRPPRWRCPVARRLLVSPPGSRHDVVLSGFLWQNGGQPLYLPLCDGGRPFASPIRPRPALVH